MPPILNLLTGEDSNGFRFTDEDISEDINSGELKVLYVP